MERTHSQSSDAPKEKEQAKLPYSTPQLTVHGTVEDLTRQLGATIADGLTASN